MARLIGSNLPQELGNLAGMISQANRVSFMPRGGVQRRKDMGMSEGVMNTFKRAEQYKEGIRDLAQKEAMLALNRDEMLYNYNVADRRTDLGMEQVEYGKFANENYRLVPEIPEALPEPEPVELEPITLPEFTPPPTFQDNTPKPKEVGTTYTNEEPGHEGHSHDEPERADTKIPPVSLRQKRINKYKENLKKIPDRKNWKAQDLQKPTKVVLFSGHSDWHDGKGAGNIEQAINEETIKRIMELAPSYSVQDLIEYVQLTERVPESVRKSEGGRTAGLEGLKRELENGAYAVEIHYDRMDKEGRSGVIPGVGEKGINILDEHLGNHYGKFDANHRDGLYSPIRGVSILELDRTYNYKGTQRQQWIDKNARKFLQAIKLFYNR